MATKDSTLYTNLDVNKFPPDARDRGGRVVPIPFEHTVVTEVSGDDVRMCVLPNGCEVVGFEAITDGVAGTNTTVEFGDSGDVNRFMIAVDFDTAEARGTLAFAGMRFRPTADTIVIMTWGASNPVAGNIVKGRFLIVPGS